MKTVWLVINKNEGWQYLKYADQYKLFDESAGDEMLAYIKKLGWTDQFGLGINPEPGIMNTNMCGDVNLSVIKLVVAA